jgi:tRNA(Ile)-lysidine synthase
MLDRFLAFIAGKDLFQNTDKILLAVSGGMDSIVMCHLFHQAQLPFAIAHCNFSLRGEESDADELFVRKLAKRYKVPFFSETFATELFARQEKISVQMAARLLRYQWFARVLQTEGYDYLATAHHANDTIETVLLNLVRGTGIAGLHGILPKNGAIVRPLLFARKEDMYAYLVENQLVWREDSSNASGKYQRNRLRQDVVPVLKELNPALEDALQQTIDKVTAVERLFAQEIERVRQMVIREQNNSIYLNYELLKAESEPLIKLAELLKNYHFSYVQARDIWQVLDASPGKQFESPTHSLVKDRQQLVIVPKSLTEYQSFDVPAGQTRVQSRSFQLHLEELPISDFTLDPSPEVACLDLETLQFPLKLRRWKPGDWFIPLGMKQKKKLSDFLINEKVPLNLKDQVWVLTSANGSIIWVLGRRIDDRFKITDTTRQVLRITRQQPETSAPETSA